MKPTTCVSGVSPFHVVNVLLDLDNVSGVVGFQADGGKAENSHWE